MADVKFVLDADTAKAVQGFLKVVDAQKKTEGQFDRTNRKGQKQGDMLLKIGTDGVRHIAGLVTQWISVAGAIGGATKALSAYNAMKAAGEDRAKSVRFQLGALSQLFAGDQQGFDKAVAEGYKTSVQAGMPLGEALGLQFGLQSFGIADQREMFADLYGTVEDVKATAEAAVTLQTAFGEKETGSIRDVLSKGLAASGKTKTSLDTIMNAMSGGAALFRQLGASDEEAWATAAVLSRVTKNPEEAITQMEGITTGLMRHDLGGKGMFAGLQAIDKELAGKTEAERIAWFGRKEGNIGALNVTNNMADVMDVFREVSAGNDLVGGAIAVRRGNELAASVERSARSTQDLEQSQMERFGETETDRGSVINEVLAERIRRGDNALELAFTKALLGVENFFGASSETLRSTGMGEPVSWLREDSNKDVVAELQGLREDVRANGGKLGQPGEDR